MIIEGFARRFLALRGGKNQTEARFTHQESMAVGQVEPTRFEMTRAARRFYLGYNGTVPTGLAPVQAFPTTAAQWVIFNGDSVKTYFFETIGALVFSGTAGIGGVMLGCVFQTPSQAGLAQVTGLAVAPASKIASSVNSLAVIKASVTLTAPAIPIWFPIADGGPGSAGATGSTIINRYISGGVAVPPGYGLGLAVLAAAGTTPLYLPIAEWIEQETDME